MRTLVLGGIRSGKSRWAEKAVAESLPPSAPVRYLATGRAADADPAWAARVAAHRTRRPAHWSDRRKCRRRNAIAHRPEVATLVDDIGGWLTAAWTAPMHGRRVRLPTP